tara:strand:- start:683 stop:1681 length:999 start_codon:yes stop_codon:yes gene_type:complete
MVLDVVILFFVLGVFARLVGSDLRLPEALYETLSIYLLLAIGLKGGIELSQQPLSSLAPEILAAALLSFLIPLLLYPIFRFAKFNWADSASIGAHFGSVSVVTFAVALAALSKQGIDYESHAPLWVAVMEAPGLVAGVLLARAAQRRAESNQLMGTSPSTVSAKVSSAQGGWKTIAHDVIFGKSVLLLLGGLFIGATAGVEGTAPIKALFIDPFKGVLALFLLELGLVAGGRLAEVKKYGFKILLLGISVPLCLAVLGMFVGNLLGLSAGGVAIFTTLAASASYIAAPTAMRIAIPQANAGLSITLSLGIVFPFNVVIGIPIYIQMGMWVTS